MDNPPDLADWVSDSKDGGNCNHEDIYLDPNHFKIDESYDPSFM